MTTSELLDLSAKVDALQCDEATRAALRRLIVEAIEGRRGVTTPAFPFGDLPAKPNPFWQPVQDWQLDRGPFCKAGK